RSLGAALVASALLLAACGGDDDSGGDAADPVATSPRDTTPGSGAETAATTAAPGTAPMGDPDDVCTDDRKGGGLTSTARGISRALDPAVSTIASEYTGSEGIPFYSMLAYLDVEAGEVVPVLAESIEPNDDMSVWTVTLREGIEFGNGDPLDAAALVAHF